VLKPARRWRACAWQIVAPVLVYILALAPVLFAGRPTFSPYMVLTDSSVHMIGADFLMRHGQHYDYLPADRPERGFGAPTARLDHEP
jgi:hypothetical protein